ncbi:MAG: aminomethyl-transferring glycine dehydrogenase subunit GcvPA [Chloroflexota bacterium]
MDFTPNTDADRAQMLRTIGVGSLDELLAVVPAQVRYPDLALPAPLTELELTAELRAMAEANQDLEHAPSFLGAGAYYHYIPAAISQLLLRSEFYTAYTPYQPEVSQGVLQALFEFQSLICSLTGMAVTNASMYDGATALAEAALMAIAATNRRKVVVSGSVHPDYRAVLATYLLSRGFQIVTSAVSREGNRVVEEDLGGLLGEDTACCIVQQPNFLGGVADLSALVERTHGAGALFVMSADPVSLGVLRSPGEWGADIAVGEGQGLGSPLAFGGPYLGLLACRERFLRLLPGRLVGMTKDGEGRRGFVLTLQAREQHIRRQKATSNICTSEALVAISAAIYLALLGPCGLRQAASLGYEKAHYAAEKLRALPGYEVLDTGRFFNEFVLKCPLPPAEVNRRLLDRKIVGGYELGRTYPELADCLLLCTTEMNTKSQIGELATALGELATAEGGSR